MGYSEADLIVEDTVVVETKAVEEIRKGFEYRIRATLASSRQEVGLILNFGVTKVEVRREVVSLEQKKKRRTG
ncbi:MAG: GxxExxY protein [Planctomycetes bacterium]|nr:GxxExxY protein [Planctomycetota bacterium]